MNKLSDIIQDEVVVSKMNKITGFLKVYLHFFFYIAKENGYRVSSRLRHYL